MDRFVMVVYYLSTLNISALKITKCKGQKLPTLESALFWNRTLF